jgi:aspartyl/asparaginyl beta-hydroxylase (cupin superfamily)
VTQASRPLIEEADRAVRAGRLADAARLFDEAARLVGDDPSLWMRSAALHRASGDFGQAQQSVQQALALDPLDFAALLLRASLIEKLGAANAGEAWDHALAQRPPGDLPAPMESMIAHAESQREAWMEGRATAMRTAMATAEGQADVAERRRIERFRSNVLRRTRPFHSSPTHFHFPELAEREFHARKAFPWLGDLEAETETIAAELDTVLHAERAELVPYIQYDRGLPLDQWRALNHNRDWTAIHLVSMGKRVEANARHCPATMDILARLPQPRIAGAGPNAMFSLLAPNTHIPPHVGVNNARLVCHLPLIVPPGCWFRVGAETVEWQRGRAFVFDDTIEHEAMNPTDELRIVMIFDVWHPDLSAVERDAVAALIGSEQGQQSQAL